MRWSDGVPKSEAQREPKAVLASQRREKALKAFDGLKF